MKWISKIFKKHTKKSKRTTYVNSNNSCKNGVQINGNGNGNFNNNYIENDWRKVNDDFNKQFK